MNNYNKNISRYLKNPGKMFIKMTNDELAEFFSKGYARLTKEKCQNTYTLTEFRRGILMANHIANNDDLRYIVDLLMFALGKIEDLQQIKTDYEQIISEYEKHTKDEISETKETKNLENIQTEDKTEELNK